MLRGVLWSALAFLLLFAAAVAILHVESVQEALLRQAFRAARPLEITAEQFRFNLGSRTAHIGGLMIRAREGDPAFVFLREAEVTWDYLRLGRGLEAISSIRGSGLAVDIARLPEGRLNLPTTREDSQPIRTLPQRVELADIRFDYSASPASFCLAPMRFSLVDRQWQIEQTEPGSFTVAGYSGSLDRLNLRGTLTALGLEGIRAEGNIAASGIRAPQVGAVAITTNITFDGADRVLRFASLDAKSPRAVARGSGQLSLRDGPSHAAISARAEGIIAEASLRWTGTDVMNAVGRANLISNRTDVRGPATVTLTPTAVLASIEHLNAFGVALHGDVQMNRRTLGLSGRVLGAYPVLDGTVSFTADLDGTARAPHAMVEARGSGLRVGPAKNFALFATAEATPQRVHLLNALAIWQNQSIRASGDVILEGQTPQLDIHASGTGLRLSEILEGLEMRVPAEGEFSVDAHVTGAARDPAVDAQIEGEQLIAYGEKLGTLAAHASYNNSLAEIRSLKLSKPQTSETGELNAHGWVDLEDRTLSFDAGSQNLRIESLKLPNGRAISAAVEFKASGSGSLDNPASNLEATMDSPSVGKVQTSATVRDRKVSFEASSDQVTLDDLGIQGGASFSARGTVPWGDWEKVEATATLPKFNLVIGQHEVTNRTPVELALRDRTIIAQRVEVQSDGANISAKGSLPFDKPSNASTLGVSGSVPLDIAERYLPPDFPADLTGTAQVEGIVGGTITSPIPDLTVITAGAGVTSPKLRLPIEEIATRARVRRERVDIESLDARLSGGTIHVEGALPFEDQPTSARATIDNVNLAPLFLEAPRFQAPISVVLEASAPKRDPRTVTASARFSQLQVIGRNGTIQQTEDTVVRLESGQLHIERFSLKGTATGLTATGTVNLFDDQKLNVRLDGQLNADVLTRNAPNYAVAGLMEAHVTLGGSVRQPEFFGNVEWRNGQFFLEDPLLAGDDINLRANFDGNRAIVERFSAEINGGRVTTRGTFAIQDGRPADVDLEITGRSVFLDYPKGFQTASNLNLTMKSAGREVLLSGRANIIDGAYREPIDIASFVRAGQREVSLVTSPNPLLESLRFNVEIRTRQPIIFDNNLGRFSTDADLRLVGTARRPGLTGRLELEEDGRIYFGGRTFSITTGVIDFTEENRIAPRFNLAATTRISEYDVTLNLTGDIGDLETTFSADPSANEDQILSLLFTGSTENVGRGSAYAQTQLLTLFGSSLTGGLSTRLRNTFGVSEFRIDPGLISPDTDPTARLTIGQNLTPEFRMTYSQNLADSRDQIWTGEYNWRRRFLARYYYQTDQSNRAEFRQRFRFGGGPQTGDFTQRPKRRTTRIGELKIDGTPELDEKTILKQLKLKPGGEYEVIKAQQGVQRLKAYYAKNGYAEARIQQDRRYRRQEARPRDADDDAERIIDLTFTIEAGQPVRFIFEGADLSGKERNRVAQLWQQGLIEQQRLRATSQEVRRTLVRKGYVDAKVQASIKPGQQTKNVLYEIDRGSKFDRPKFEFTSVPRSTAQELRDAVRRQKLDREVKSNPATVTTFFQQYLRQQGYLSAKVEALDIQIEDKDEMRVKVPVVLGPEFLLGNIAFEGDSSMNEDALRMAMVLEPGDKYVPEDRYTISQRVQQAYWNAGFRQADVDVEEKLDTGSGRVNIVVKIDEKQKFEIAEVKLQGLSETSESFVRRRLELEEGDVLNAQKINDSRKNMLDSGAYNLIDFTYPPVGPTSIPPAPQPVAMVVKVREPKPYRVDIGGTYDFDRGPGGLVDISTINKLGEARTLGLRTLVDRQQQEYRLYFSQPFFGRQRINTTSTAYIQNERIEAFDTRRRGFTLQQYIRLGPRFNFAYGYKYEWAHVLANEPGLTFTGVSAPLTSTLVRDSRDNSLDATKGSFVSTSIEYANGFTASDVSYFRFYTQAFKYFGLSKPELMPFEGDRRRSRRVFATGVRAGIANTLDEQFFPIDRFFAGGGTTIRGYSLNSVGPQLDGEAVGGEATFIINNELRFPLYKFFDGVAFIDAGNVWAKPSEFSITDLRAGAGFGIRVRNPFVIVRFDYGFKLGRRPGESVGAFFFSIGQAF